MKVLIDTNVWLDVITGRKPFYYLSKAVILACINDEVDMKVAATSIKDIFYLVARNLDASSAYEAVETILSIANIASVDRLICSQALDLERPDYEDGIIAAVALTENIDCIISRDTKAFQSAAITKYSPAEFLQAQEYEEIEF